MERAGKQTTESEIGNKRRVAGKNRQQFFAATLLLIAPTHFAALRLLSDDY